jgi:hypothetical protein
MRWLLPWTNRERFAMQPRALQCCVGGAGPKHLLRVAPAEKPNEAALHDSLEMF